jgi:hypothetical protein
MYKVRIQDLESLKKQLEANNKHLATHTQTPAINKLIKANNKQINAIKDAAPILA